MKTYRLLWVVGAVMLAVGIMRGEFRNIFINAAAICLSCIGIG